MTDSQVVELKCPKCLGSMRPVERSGVVIDICQDCRGIFLDRGELERLMDGESRYWQEQQPLARPSEPLGGYIRGGHGGGHGGRKRRGFLGELFD